MSSCCEEKLNSLTEGILLASAEQLCSLTSPRSRTLVRNGGQRPPLTPSKSASDNPFMLRSKSVDRIERESPSQNDLTGPVVMRRHGSKLSYGSNDSAGSSSSAGQSKGKGSRVSSIADLSGIVRSQSVLHIDLPHDVLSGARLSRGKDNTLFNYVYLESGEGILICPTEAELSEVHSNLQQEVIQNFCLSCQKIRPLFAQQVPKSDSSEIEPSLFSTSRLIDTSYIEAGVLFHCAFQSNIDRKQQVSSLGYWVIGRCWSSPSHQEMYVCCHESANQALVEMAFSIGFGT
ncbi:unnamed protein product [Lymnaea stagnalis]|uniref:CCZ1/INTU/HPS4 third Longin domain-containing protein n=1 Tax=Lymnaea stagnalis TaxID=6523 RepID=A0AAV2H247_LYMST